MFQGTCFERPSPSDCTKKLLEWTSAARLLTYMRYFGCTTSFWLSDEPARKGGSEECSLLLASNHLHSDHVTSTSAFLACYPPANSLRSKKAHSHKVHCFSLTCVAFKLSSSSSSICVALRLSSTSSSTSSSSSVYASSSKSSSTIRFALPFWLFPSCPSKSLTAVAVVEGFALLPSGDPLSPRRSKIELPAEVNVAWL